MRLELTFTNYAHSDYGQTCVFERIESIRMTDDRLYIAERRAKGISTHQFRPEKIADIRLSVYQE